MLANDADAEDLYTTALKHDVPHSVDPAVAGAAESVTLARPPHRIGEPSSLRDPHHAAAVGAPVGRVEMLGLRHLIHVGHLQRGPNDQ
jgi:hypothetical protein